MAIRDVKQYYYEVLAQYAEMKQDLADFDIALKNGYITEDKLAEAKKQVEVLESNFNRISYIVYLLELPNRKAKQARWEKSNKDITDNLATLKADKAAVLVENRTALKTIREELKKLEKE